MDTQDGDEEVFEIVDFTTASNWEVFTAHIEELLQEWQLCGPDRSAPPVVPPGKLGSLQWKEVSQIIKYVDFPFQVSYHEIIYDSNSNDETQVPQGAVDNASDDEYEDDDSGIVPPSLHSIHDCDNPFPSRAHCIARWYGLRQFVLVAPHSNSCSVTQSKARLILSALTVACNNTNCEVPVIVQVLRPSDRMFLGTVTSSGVRADIDMIHLRHNAPSDCQHFDGIIRLLSNKLQVLEMNIVPLTSARLTYMITDWPEEACWSQSPPDLDLDLGGEGELGYSAIGQLPFGLLYDPVRELQISAIWPQLPNKSFTDCSGSFNLQPCQAPQWTAKVLPNALTTGEPQIAGLLGEHLSEFINICNEDKTLCELLGPAFEDYAASAEANVNIASAFDRLTEHSIPSLGSVIMKQYRKRRSRNNTGAPQGPLSDEVLIALINYLFPEDEIDGNGMPYTKTFSRVPPSPSESSLPEEPILKDVSASIKSCPAESLVWRLAVLCSHALHSLGGLHSVAHLLFEFILELRYRWDNCEVIPGVSKPSDPPDLGMCLLQQKLQMLNCCITHRANREKLATLGKDEDETVEEEEIDEFFDCNSGDEEDDDNKSEQVDSSLDEKLSEWDKPEGRLKVCGNLRLLRSPHTRMYVPLTQDPAPVTEDRLEEQAEVLMRLGDTDEGSAMRARLLSSSLLSDMEAFKASNPGCILADFVRWYSPRDWIPVKDAEDIPGTDVEIINGHRLSDRMIIPGNLWQEVWQGAHPVPARRQKRLFDDTRQAEGVLKWISDLTVGGFCKELLPVLLHAACCTASHQPTLYSVPAAAAAGELPAVQHHGGLSALLVLVTQRLGRLSRQPPDLKRYREIVEQLMVIEKCIGRALSLRHKLLPSERSEDDEVLVQLISELLSSTEVVVEGAANGVAGQAIRRLFKRALQNNDELMGSDSKGSDPRQPSITSGADTIPSFVRKGGADVACSELGVVGAREYIIRVRCEQPSPSSRLLPHRVYATLMPGDLRIAGVFLQDTTFT